MDTAIVIFSPQKSVATAHLLYRRVLWIEITCVPHSFLFHPSSLQYSVCSLRQLSGNSDRVRFVRWSVNAGKTFFCGAARLLLQSSLKYPPTPLFLLLCWLFDFSLFVFFLMQRETAVAAGASTLCPCIVHNSGVECISRHGSWCMFALREVVLFLFLFCK